jgi:hypothetical protein
MNEAHKNMTDVKETKTKNNYMENIKRVFFQNKEPLNGG